MSRGSAAIVHQNSREQNCELFRKVFAALDRGGRILIRDIVMEESRTAPIMGAYSRSTCWPAHIPAAHSRSANCAEDLESAGFRDVSLIRKDEGMHSVVSATKPE